MSDKDVITETKGLDEDFQNLTTTGPISALKRSKKVMDCPSGALELGTEIDSAAISKNPKPATSALMLAINFYQTGINLFTRQF